ncbi:hypothetical protein D3C72_1674230 [compost metagenome]
MTRCAPERPHHGLHQHPDKLEQTEAEQKGEGHGADRDDEAHRHGQLVEQERQAIRGHQPGRPHAGHIHDGQHQPEQLEQTQQPVDGAGPPAAVQQGRDGTIGDQQQDQPQGERTLRHQESGQVIHQYGAASRQLKGHEKDRDPQHTGQQQLDAYPRFDGSGEYLFRFHSSSL